MASNTLEITLVRSTPESWGLRLQGGVDLKKVLSIMYVNEGSPSQHCGLKTGDVILEINGQSTGDMTHQQALDTIVSSGDKVVMIVQRGGYQDSLVIPGMWKPTVEVVDGVTKTSLVAPPVPEDSHWDVKHNITAKGFKSEVTTPGFRSVCAPVTKLGGGDTHTNASAAAGPHIGQSLLLQSTPQFNAEPKTMISGMRPPAGLAASLARAAAAKSQSTVSTNNTQTHTGDNVWTQEF